MAALSDAEVLTVAVVAAHAYGKVPLGAAEMAHFGRKIIG